MFILIGAFYVFSPLYTRMYVFFRLKRNILISALNLQTSQEVMGFRTSTTGFIEILAKEGKGWITKENTNQSLIKANFTLRSLVLQDFQYHQWNNVVAGTIQSRTLPALSPPRSAADPS